MKKNWKKAQSSSQNSRTQMIKGGAILIAAALVAFYALRPQKKTAVRNANQPIEHVALITENSEGLGAGLGAALGKPVTELVLTSGMQGAPAELAAKVEAGEMPRPQVVVIAAGHSASDLGALLKDVELASQIFVNEGHFVAFLPRVPAAVGDNFNLMASDLCRQVGALCLGISDNGRQRRELSATDIAAALKPYF